MSKQRIFDIACLVLYIVIILLPPLVHGYVYPNIGDDSAVYLTRIEGMGKGTDSIQYLGYAITGYPMLFFRDIFGWDINIQFVWLNFIALVLTGLVLYFVFSRIVNRLTGWLALLLILFCSQGILFLFYFGQIYNLINIGIILPLLFFFTARYIEKGKLAYLILTITFSIVFSSFHTNGIYLPAIAGCGLVSYLIYSKVTKKPLLKRAVYLGGGITLVALVVFVVWVVLPTMQQLREFSDSPLSSTMNNVGKGMAVPLNSWLMSILSPTILVFIALMIVYLNNIQQLFTDHKVKIFIFLLGILIFLLALVSFAKLSLDPWRQAVDLATVCAMFVAVCIGLLLTHYKNTILLVAVCLAITFGLYHNLPTWFSYNSAIRKVDLQAIEYLKDYKVFSCSSQVAFWIYERYTDCKHKDNQGEVVVMRSKPMTPRSSEDNIWYQKHGWQPDNSYELVEIYDDGEVKIEIYAVKDYFKLEKLQRLLASKNLMGAPEILETTAWRCPECRKKNVWYDYNTDIMTDNPPVLQYKCECGYSYRFEPIKEGNWYEAVYGGIK